MTSPSFGAIVILGLLLLAIFLLWLAAHFIEADRRDRADQGESRREREQQRQQLVVEGEAREHQARDGIDDAEKEHVRPARREVVDSAGERVLEVGKSDAADGGAPGAFACLRAAYGAPGGLHVRRCLP